MKYFNDFFSAEDNDNREEDDLPTGEKALSCSSNYLDINLRTQQGLWQKTAAQQCMFLLESNFKDPKCLLSIMFKSIL